MFLSSPNLLLFASLSFSSALLVFVSASLMASFGSFLKFLPMKPREAEGKDGKMIEVEISKEKLMGTKEKRMGRCEKQREADGKLLEADGRLRDAKRSRWEAERRKEKQMGG
jgi:hypothetical protein